MVKTLDYEIPSCDDTELNIKRDSKLHFKVTFDDEKEIKALLFFIPGLGEDMSASYREHLAEFVAKEYPVAVVGVDYFCVGNRPQVGSKCSFDTIDKLIFKTSLETINLKFDDSFLDRGILENKDINENLGKLNLVLGQMKEQGLLKPDFRLKLTTTLNPTKNEYNNFGIMSAMDIINALLFVRKNPPFKAHGGGHLPAFLLGSSHGGYLAHLAAKLSPWNVQAVVDNSGYAKFFWRFIGFGKEIDFEEHYSCSIWVGNIILYMFDKTFWTSNTKSSNYFSPSRREIRYNLNPKHLEIQSKYPKPKYISYHSILDEIIAPANEKIELYEKLKALNFNTQFFLAKSEKDIDGKLIKNLTHGMGMSLKTLIQKELPPLLDEFANFKLEWDKKEISYPTPEWNYHFKEEGDQLKLNCERI